MGEAHMESTEVCRGKEQNDVKGWWWVSSWTSRIVLPATCRAEQSIEQAAWLRQNGLDGALFWIHKDLSYASNRLLSLRYRFMLHHEQRQGTAVYYWGCVCVYVTAQDVHSIYVCWHICSAHVCLLCVWWEHKHQHPMVLLPSSLSICICSVSFHGADLAL